MCILIRLKEKKKTKKKRVSHMKAESNETWAEEAVSGL